jgi:predicted metal-dependent peptidase
MSKILRDSVDETLANMFSSPTYSPNYLFYAHMISQCTIKMDSTLPAVAGVAFNIDHYDLYLNETELAKLPLIEGLGVMKHEMLHILQNHVHRTEERKKLPFNFATDCAINQQIERSHMPKITQDDINKMDPMIVQQKNIKVGDTSAVYPDNFPVKVNVKKNMHAEYYYDLLLDEAEDQEDEEQECDKCGGSGEMDDESEDKESEDGEPKEPKKCSCNNCGGSGKTPGKGYGDGNGKLVDDHDTWQKSEGDKDLQKDMTKKMIEQSISQTQKSRGNIPQDIPDMLALFTRKSVVSWSRILKKLTGNKRVGKRGTIMRKPRRFTNRPDLKGTTKNRLYTVVACVDISGSMSTEEIMMGMNEIHHVCKISKSKLKLIQVDTEVHKVEEFTEKTKIFERSGCGGTYMYDGWRHIRENKIEHDLIIYITDGYIEDVSEWEYQPKCRVMWL